MERNTNWSSPKTNIFAAVKDLMIALNSGRNATLIKEWNEDCNYPIRKKNQYLDFRAYESIVSHPSTIKDIDESDMTDFEKYLSLNYTNCYGFQEAVDRYYETGELTMDNVRGVGKAHLVKVTDLLELLRNNNHDGSQTKRIQGLMDTYIHGMKGWFDFFKLKRGKSLYTVQKFKRKLWVVELRSKDDEKPKQPFLIKMLLKLYKPFYYLSNFIPVRSVVKMDEYTSYTFRIGDVINGFSVEFHIPKKFSFQKTI
ncbi:MAG: hypothetical protein ACOC22_03105 [bacterium]